MITDSNSSLLSYHPLTHAHIKPVYHPRLGTEINGQSAVKCLRFMRPVKIERLELPHGVYGRWVPKVPCHPAHVVVSVLDSKTHRWKTVREVEFPPNPRIAGEGLSQRMRVEEMEAHFDKVMQEPPYTIELGGLRTDHLRVECDREHPVWPNHGECNGGPFSVPFGILDPLQAYGTVGRGAVVEPAYRPLLRVGSLHPVAPKGMQVRERLASLMFEGKRLSVGFSLRRPMITHLGWDALGQGLSSKNRILSSRKPMQIGGLSGPLIRSLDMDCGAHIWTGEVSVRGKRITYHNLTCGVPGITVDATFVVEPDRLSVELTQVSDADTPVIEYEPWRLCWDILSCMTGAAAVPTLLPGRNGDVQLPMLWAGDGVGCLECRLPAGAPNDARLQVESHHSAYSVVGGFELGERPTPDACRVVPTGTRRATFELAVTNLEPKREKSSPRPTPAVRRHWASVFSCYRPEYGGFSNHAVSVNCHVNQHGPLEVVAHTKRHKSGWNPLDLTRFTTTRALLDGSGYGYWRNLYLDSDPILVSAAGRLHQVEPNPQWLRKVEPGLREAIQRLEGTIGKEKLAICRDLSGNSGSYRWSSNAMDVVGFGHIDAYVNAWTYRAFRNATALMKALGDEALAARCGELAKCIRAGYANQLVNPETGWVAGWRSRDGQLHDYAFLWINGVALAFGLLDRAAARRALRGLERLRDEVGPDSANLGLPFNLLPIREEDHILAKARGWTQPTFEHYTDGALAACAAPYYLRALSIHGFKDRAQKLAEELEEGYLDGAFTGGIGSGVEFRSWEGVPSGYEGTFGPSFAPLYGIAIERDLVKPTEPEWWPA